ncbi:MAG: alpha/beta hydrolase [Planctomycetales bacterium]|nr:alpha/beta hydrolase [Planctomycetales bacterium]
MSQLRATVCSLLFLGLQLVSNLTSSQSLGQEPNAAQTAQYFEQKDILYRNEPELNDYAKLRCRLDLYYPQNMAGFPTVVWFHGGGLRGGEKSIPTDLKGRGIAIVAANYRLHPNVTAPTYIEDAAAAVAWTFKNIERLGGDPNRIFVSGHSAGGYLTSMIGLDSRWLRAHEIDCNSIAGLIPYSGHCITHFTVREERGISGTQPIVDDLAPLFHVRENAPPLLLITGDRDMEMLGRYEENAYMWRMMLEAGHQHTELFELEGYDHGGMAVPAHPLLLKFVRQITTQPNN